MSDASSESLSYHSSRHFDGDKSHSEDERRQRGPSDYERSHKRYDNYREKLYNRDNFEKKRKYVESSRPLNVGSKMYDAAVEDDEEPQTPTKRPKSSKSGSSRRSKHDDARHIERQDKSRGHPSRESTSRGRSPRGAASRESQRSKKAPRVSANLDNEEDEEYFLHQEREDMKEMLQVHTDNFPELLNIICIISKFPADDRRPSIIKQRRDLKFLIVGALNLMTRRWNCPGEPSKDFLGIALELTDGELDELNMAIIDEKVSHQKLRLNTIERGLIDLGLILDEKKLATAETHKQEFSKLMSQNVAIVSAAIEFGHFTFSAISGFRNIRDPEFIQSRISTAALAGSKEPALLKLLREFSALARTYNYMRHDGKIYGLVVSKKCKDANIKHDTRTYEAVHTFEEFVAEAVPEEMISLLYSTSNMKAAVTKNLIDFCQFPKISPTEHTVAFINGVYNDDTRVFTRWDRITTNITCTKYHDLFFVQGDDDIEPHLMPLYYKEIEDNAAVRARHQHPQYEPTPVSDLRPHINMWYDDDQKTTVHTYTDEQGRELPRPFKDYHNWYDIPTPAIQTIFEHQKLDRNVCRWAYVMLGRLLFNVREKDTWEVMMFILGVAGSGKSTLLNLAASLFNSHEVGVVQNNIEPVFGLQEIAEKKVWMCSEVRKSFGLNQGVWQSMVTGERLTIQRKGLPSKSIPNWTIPGIMSGNEYMGWQDTNESVVRRVLSWLFNEILNTDPRVNTKLSELTDLELAAFRYKITCAYQQAVDEANATSLHHILPKYFKESSNALRAASNPLVQFIEQADKVERDPTYFVPVDEFKEAFYLFCSVNKLPAQRFTDPELGVSLNRFGIKVSNAVERVNYKHTEINKILVRGIRLVDQDAY